MPATVTHACFAKDVFDILPGKISKLLDIDSIKMFGQGTDSLLFYNLFSILPGKDIRKFQAFFHTHNTQAFFINLINYMKDNNISKTDTYSFLVGFICHYALDSTLHPYIIYKTGVFNKGKPNTYKYNNVHAFMETFIDNDMIKRRFKTNPYEFDICNYCFDIKPFSKELENTINYSFYNTFKIRGMSNIYYKSLKQMRLSIKLFRKDKYGVKKNIYRFVDTLTPRSTFRFEAVSYHYPLEDKHDYLNSDHKLWRNPTTYNLTSNESFVDLYLNAIKKAKVMIVAAFDYLDGKEIELDKVFLNNSYITGLSCDNKKELKYFEF